MAVDFAGMLRQANEYLRLHVKSKAVRAAEERRLERRSRRAMRRLRRAALVGGTSGGALLGSGALVAPIGGPLLVGAGAGVLAAVALCWPTRRRAADGDFSQAELAALPGEAEDWLLAKREQLPVGARPLLDRLFLRLGDLQPHLALLPPHGTSAWEARRLLGEHLPQLILAYEGIPASAREEDPQVRERLLAGLMIIGDALDELCREVCSSPLRTFETRGRFIESRYKGSAAEP